jgi:hypothetical protein
VEANSCTCLCVQVYVLVTFIRRWIVFTHTIGDSYPVFQCTYVYSENTSISFYFIYLCIILPFKTCALADSWTDDVHGLLCTHVSKCWWVDLNTLLYHWLKSHPELWSTASVFDQSYCKCFSSSLEPQFTISVLITGYNFKSGYHFSTVFNQPLPLCLFNFWVFLPFSNFWKTSIY